MEQLNNFFAAASGYVWGVPLLILLVGTGILLTVRLRGIQVTMLGHALRETFARSRENEMGDISHFKALMIAWRPPSAPVTSSAWPRLFRWAGPAPCSGCG